MKHGALAVLMVLMLSACATTGGPSGSVATWPNYTYVYTSNGVQYVYLYPYGPLKVVTPSTWPKPEGQRQGQGTAVPPAPQNAPQTSK